MSEEQATSSESQGPQADEDEVIDNAVDPGVTAVVQNSPPLPIVKPRKRHPLLLGIVVVLIIAFLLFAGWLMLFKRI